MLKHTARVTKTTTGKAVAFYNNHPRAFNVVKIGALFILFTVFCYRRLDTDFGWHLTTGNYIRHNGIPATDIYTHTAPNYPWINHEWGNDVIMSLLYQYGGYGALSLVFGGLWTAGVCLFRKKQRFIVLLIATVAMLPYAGVRTQAWTVFGLALLLELITRGTKRSKLVILPMMLIWVNLHGGFIIALAVLAYYWLKTRDRDWLLLFFGGVLTSFINPYGPRLYVEIFHTLINPRIHYQITEWMYFHILPPSWCFILLWAVCFSLVAKNKLKNWFGLAPLLLLASMSASRNLPLFAVAALRDLDTYLPKIERPKKLDLPKKFVLYSFLTLVTIWILSTLNAYFLPWSHKRGDSYPTHAVSYLRTHQCPGNLFNSYTYGGYLIWKLPSLPVYIDGRMPTWTAPDGRRYNDTYLDVFDTPSVQKTEFSKHNIGCVLLQKSNVTKELIGRLNKTGWKTVSDADGAVLIFKP